MDKRYPFIDLDYSGEKLNFSTQINVLNISALFTILTTNDRWGTYETCKRCPKPQPVISSPFTKLKWKGGDKTLSAGGDGSNQAEIRSVNEGRQGVKWKKCNSGCHLMIAKKTPANLYSAYLQYVGSLMRFEDVLCQCHCSSSSLLGTPCKQSVKTSLQSTRYYLCPTNITHFRSSRRQASGRLLTKTDRLSSWRHENMSSVYVVTRRAF